MGYLDFLRWQYSSLKLFYSHNHYDHLSHPTIMKIRDLHPQVQFFVPLKNKEWFIKCDIHNVTELDWWEERDILLSQTPSKDKPAQGSDVVVQNGSGTQGASGRHSDIVARIGCLPCQHTSARTPFDKARTLWASWSVESGGKKIYFGGSVVASLFSTGFIIQRRAADHFI